VEGQEGLQLIWSRPSRDWRPTKRPRRKAGPLLHRRQQMWVRSGRRRGYGVSLA